MILSPSLGICDWFIVRAQCECSTFHAGHVSLLDQLIKRNTERGANRIWATLMCRVWILWCVVFALCRGILASISCCFAMWNMLNANSIELLLIVFWFEKTQADFSSQKLKIMQPKSCTSRSLIGIKQVNAWELGWKT